MLTFILGLIIVVPFQYVLVSTTIWGRRMIERRPDMTAVAAPKPAVPPSPAEPEKITISPRIKNTDRMPDDAAVVADMPPFIRALRLGVDLIELIISGN